MMGVTDVRWMSRSSKTSLSLVPGSYRLAPQSIERLGGIPRRIEGRPFISVQRVRTAEEGFRLVMDKRDRHCDLRVNVPQAEASERMVT